MLSHRDVACVLAEPVMTNCGMVLPEPGYHDALRELTTKYGTYLIVDETHTYSTGPGGYTAAYGLKPDFITLGKAIAGGIPAAAYGFTLQVAEAINATFGKQHLLSDPMGIGGTLSANAFAIARVPSRKASNSNTPMGPFQTTVLAVRICSTNASTALGPISNAIQSFGI